MEIIELIDKKEVKKLYQWDLDRKLKITPPEGFEVDEAHVAHPQDKEALVVRIREVDGMLVADIPNILLQSSQYIKVWLVCGDQTICAELLTVIERAKPADYVYTETEILRYENLEKRIAELEKDFKEFKENGNGSGNGEPGADGFSPEAKVEETADGAKITITDKNGTTEATVEHGKDGKDGNDGYTPVKGTDYFTEADKQELIQSVFAQVVNGNEVAY